MANDGSKLITIKDIDEAITAGNLESLMDNKFLKVEDPQAISVIKNLFEQIKATNPSLANFSFSILVLFASVLEVWNLTQDRLVYKEFMKKQLPKDLVIVEKDIVFETKRLEMVNTKMALYERKLKQIDMSDLNTLEQYDEITSQISMMLKNQLGLEKSLRALELKKDSMNLSVQMKQYNISNGGNLWSSLESNLMSKYKSVSKLLTEYNLTPSSIQLDAGHITEGTVASKSFDYFNNAKADEVPS